MKWSMTSVFVIMLGLIGFVVIFFFQEVAVSNEQDYYSLKEIAEAAMIDSVDIAAWRLNGEIKIVEQAFVENFSERLKKSATYGKDQYTVEFYDIWESPPKVTIKIINKTDSTKQTDITLGETDIVNELSAILVTGETFENNDEDEEDYSDEEYFDDDYYDESEYPDEYIDEGL